MSTVGFKSISASGGASGGSRGLGSRGQVKGTLRSQSAFQPGTIAASGGDGEVSRSTELNSLLAGLRSKGRLGGGGGTPTTSLAKTKRDEADEDDEFARLERTLDEEARVRSRSTTGGEKVRAAPVVAVPAPASQHQPQQEKPRTPALRLPSRTAGGTRAASAVPQPCTPPSGGGRGGAATGLRSSSPSFTLPRTRTPAFGKKSSNEEKDETAEFERLEAELALASARRKEMAVTGSGGGGSNSTRGVVSRSPAVRGGAFKPAAASAARQPRETRAAAAAAPAPVVVAPVAAADAAAAPPAPEDADVPPVIPVFRRVAAPPPRLVHSSNPPPLTRSEQPGAARPATSSFLSSTPAVAAADSPPHSSSATAAAESSAPAGEQTRKPVALSFGLGRQQTPPPAAASSSSGLNIPQNIVLRRHTDPAAATTSAGPPKAAAPAPPAALSSSSAFTRPTLASPAAASPAPAPGPSSSAGSGIIIPQNIFLRRPAAPPVVGGGGTRSSPPSVATAPATAPAVSAATPQAARRESEPPAAAPASPAAVSQPRSRRVVRKSLEYEPTGAAATPPSSATPPPRRSVSSAAVPSPDSVVVLTPPLHTRSESPPRPAPEDDVAYLDYIERLVKSLQAGEAPPSDGGLQGLFSSPLRSRGGGGARGDAYEKLCNEILPGLQKSTGNLTLTDSQKQELRAKLTLIRDTLSEPENGGAAAAVAAAAEDENWLLSNDSFGKVGDVAVATTPAASPAVTPPVATTPAKGRESAGSHGVRARSEPHSRHIVGRPRVAAAAAEREARSLHPRDSTTSIVTAGSSHAGSTVGATAKQRSRSQGGTGPVKALEMKIESQDKKLQRQEKKVRTLKAENTELALRVKALTFEREKGVTGGGRTTPVSSSVLGRSEASLRESAGALSRQSQSSSGVTPVSVPVNRPTTPALYVHVFFHSIHGYICFTLSATNKTTTIDLKQLSAQNTYTGAAATFSEAGKARRPQSWTEIVRREVLPPAPLSLPPMAKHTTSHHRSHTRLAFEHSWTEQLPWPFLFSWYVLSRCLSNYFSVHLLSVLLCFSTSFRPNTGDVSFLQHGTAATGGGSVPRRRAAPA